MGGSFALRHFLFRQAPAAPAAPAARPPGTLVWIDATARAHPGAAAEVAARIAAQPGDRVALVSGAAGPLPPGAVAVEPPGSTLEAAERFLDHWQPAAVLVLGAVLRPALIEAARRRGVPLLMADAAAPAVAGGGWWPGLLRRSLGAFAEVLARDTAALVALRRAGADPARLHVGGALVEIGRALPCTEAERAALARAVGTRPSWLAVGVPAAEDARVAAAHQAALRMTHRLLLFVVPDDANRAEAVAAAMAAEGLTVARRSLDQDIDDDTHVYLADTEGELGLWYRLAPVAYFGGTLSGEAGVRHPFEAAALGAAILRGPASGGLGAHGPLWDDLRAAGACRLVRDADDLGEAVGDLLAPDRAAAMARAGWEASSAGTVAAERVMAMLDAVLGPPPAPDPGAEAGAPARRRRRREA